MGNLQGENELAGRLKRMEIRFHFLMRNVCEDFIEIDIQTGECCRMHCLTANVSRLPHRDQVVWFAQNFIVPEQKKSYEEEFQLDVLLDFLRHNGGMKKSVYKIQRQGGNHYWLIVHILVCSPNEPAKEYILGYAQDITEIKRYETKNRQLQDMSRQLMDANQYDSLTRLYNRAAAENLIAAHLERSRKNFPGVLLLMDIDYFKQINDGGGHTAGDCALCFMAQAMRQAFRSEDILCRWGGDEFLVFMRDVGDMEIAAARFECLRLKMLKCKIGDKQRAVRLSAGAVMARSASAVEMLFRQADRLLYEVKRAGRNGFRGALDEL